MYKRNRLSALLSRKLHLRKKSKSGQIKIYHKYLILQKHVDFFLHITLCITNYIPKYSCNRRLATGQSLVPHYHLTGSSWMKILYIDQYSYVLQIAKNAANIQYYLIIVSSISFESLIHVC